MMSPLPLNTTRTESPSFGASSVMPTLDVENLQSAVEFYRQLGFKECWRYPDASSSGSPESSTDATSHIGTHACIAFGEVNLMLALHDSSCGPIQRQNLYFIIADTHAYHQHLSKTLSPERTELTAVEEQPYGMMDFAVRDPWNHLLTFGQSAS